MNPHARLLVGHLISHNFLKREESYTFETLICCSHMKKFAVIGCLHTTLFCSEGLFESNVMMMKMQFFVTL